MEHEYIEELPADLEAGLVEHRLKGTAQKGCLWVQGRKQKAEPPGYRKRRPGEGWRLGTSSSTLVEHWDAQRQRGLMENF